MASNTTVTTSSNAAYPVELPILPNICEFAPVKWMMDKMELYHTDSGMNVYRFSGKVPAPMVRKIELKMKESGAQYQDGRKTYGYLARLALHGYFSKSIEFNVNRATGTATLIIKELFVTEEDKAEMIASGEFDQALWNEQIANFQA